MSLCLGHHLYTVPSPLSATLDSVPSDLHLQPLVLYLYNDIEYTLSKDQAKDDPAQNLLCRACFIFHVVRESRQEGRDKQHAALIQKFKPVLFGILKRPPHTQVDELNHTCQME